jgi:predicted MFS family arabinose efflux permease
LTRAQRLMPYTLATMPVNHLENEHASSISEQKASPEAAVPENTQTAEPEDPYKLTSPRTITIVSAFCLCVFLTAFDAVAIGNTLPAIIRDLHSTGNSYVWVGSAYNMAWASLLLTWAKLSDIFGRKPIVLLGAAIFVVGSIVAATAHSMAALIAGRTVQGLGAGALLVVVGICATDMFSLRYG